MRRIIGRSTEMGARITAEGENEGCAPLVIQGGPLQPIDYHAAHGQRAGQERRAAGGLYAEGETSVTEPGQSRDHTERLLRYFLVDVKQAETIRWPRRAEPAHDQGRADARIAQLHACPATSVERGVLAGGGGGAAGRAAAGQENRPQRHAHGHPLRAAADGRARPRGHRGHRSRSSRRAPWRCRARGCTARSIEGREIPNVIDEIPILAVLGAHWPPGKR